MCPKLKYTGIRVRDMEKAVQFYTRHLGMEEICRTSFPETNGESVSLCNENPGPVLELNHYGKGSKFDTKFSPGDALDHLGFKVEDLDAFLQTARAAGVAQLLEMKSQGVRWAYIEGPDKVWIEVFE